MTIERWYRKASAYADGWKSIFSVYPSKDNVALGLSVAEHETECGDAWPGEENWGAIQKRVPTPAEHAVIGNVKLVRVAPDGKAIPLLEAIANATTDARAKLDAAVLSGAVAPPDHEALHIDSSPTTGFYFVWFWAFPTEAEGAAKFIHVLAQNRPSCRVILESSPKPADGGCHQLAAAMYATHYYEGVHDPHNPGGVEANIDDYTNALSRLRPTIAAALLAWSPGAAPPAPVDCDLCTVEGLQHALNVLGASPPLTEDGSFGPKTEAALTKVQVTLNVVADGKCGPATRAAIGAALAALGVTWSASCSGLTR